MRVYSYLRFSTPKQAHGNSADRQTEYAKRWAQEHGMELDESLSMRDEGLSAYHQAHVRSGALGAFLRAIDSGDVPAGSVLVVEGLDRLSRAEPINAQGQLSQIISAGITVVTASDGREYNRENLRTNPMDLLYALLVMIRAYEESETKSKRVRSAARKACEIWVSGGSRAKVINIGRDPAWLRRKDGKWELIPERAEAVRAAMLLYGDGLSGLQIFKALADRGIDAGLIGVNTNALYRITKRDDVIGIKTVAIEGTEYRLEGYYPAIMTPEEWQQVKDASSGRLRRSAKSTIPGLITGLGITRCGYCGESLVAQNGTSSKTSRDASGRLRDSARRLWCNSRNSPTRCSIGSCSVAPVEHALLNYCSDQMRLDSLVTGDSRTQTLRANLAALRANRDQLETQIGRITAALMASEDSAPIAFARQARKLEDEQAGIEREIRSIEAELSRTLNMSSEPALAGAWASLSAAALALDHDARIKVRKLIADTFRQITIWHQAGEPNIQMQIISHTGAARILSIDRASGAWQEGFDYQIEDA